MKKRIAAVLLCFALCLTTFMLSVAAASTVSTITISKTGLKPGYYLGSIWNNGELLTLFDCTVGNDGKLETVVDLGKSFPQGTQLRVGISGQNAGSEPISITYTVGSEEPTKPTPSPSPSPSPDPSPSPTQPTTPTTPGISFTIYTPSAIGGQVYTAYTSAVAGSSVTFTAYPWDNYNLDSVYVTDSYGQFVPLTWQNGNSYWFTMPSSTVTIYATFTRQYIPNPSNPIANPSVPAVTPAEYMGRWYYSGGAIVDSVSGTVPFNSNLTRDMLVSIVYNLDGSHQETPIVWAVNNKIVKNYLESQLYGPDMEITKDQMAFILHNFAQYKGYNVSAQAAGSSTPRTVTWAAYSWANAMQLFNGIDGDATAKITCNQAAVVLQRFISIIG